MDEYSRTWIVIEEYGVIFEMDSKYGTGSIESQLDRGSDMVGSINANKAIN